MKKLILICSILLTGMFQSFGSHLMGGQITASQISGNLYEIRMTLYRDTTGIPISLTADFTITDLATSTANILNTSHTGVQSFINGVELYEYVGTFSFPAAGTYSIEWEECCRNAAILNMSNPGSESLHLRTEVTVDATPNSTPVFLNPPVTLAQKNSLYTYNPLPFDVDGDSMAWSLEIPLTQGGDTVNGYTIPQGAASNPFTLDNMTGEITWMPDSNGHWEASFLVEEFRNGIKTGEIRRDMQIIVVDDTTNYSPMIVNTTSWPQDVNGHFVFTLQPSVPFYLNVQATQGDNDPMNLFAQGEPFLNSGNPAQFSVINNVPGTINAMFSWTPSPAQQRTAPYLVTIRAFEYHNNYVFTNDNTILFRVGSATGINELKDNISSVKIYPNPASDMMFSSFTITKSSTFSMEIFDLSGRMVYQSAESFLPAGQHLNNHSVSNLAKGFYTVHIMLNKQQAASLPLIVK